MKAAIKYLFFLLSISFGLQAQNGLETPIRLSKPTVSIQDILTAIENQSEIQFSFNPDKLPLDSTVQILNTPKPAKTLLKEALGERLITKSVGNIVILKMSAPKPSPKKKTKRVKIRGVITDKRTKKKIKDVTVYNAEDLKPVLTDTAGVFNVEVPDTGKTALVVKKKDYLDTLIVVSPLEEAVIEIEQKPFDKLREKIDSIIRQDIDSLKIMKWFLKKEIKTHAKNFEQNLQKLPFQASLVPGLSTRGVLSGASQVNVSLNLLGGYVGSVHGIEAGGFVNILKNDLKGFQAAGFANIVGGKVKGTQIAGFTNITVDTVKGMQVAGFYNHSSGTTEGAQIAGFANISRFEQKGIQLAGFTNICPQDIKSLQASGFFNYGKRLEGSQFAGFSNVATDTTQGIQASGFFNYGKNVKGAQFAGFMNVSKNNMQGIQAAGFMNVCTKDLKGAQVAGFMNVARKVDGIQIGFINIASDSIKGIPIGFLSFAKNGYFRVQAEYSPEFTARVGIKTGVRHFYNSLAVGITPDQKISSGYGIGTMIYGKYFAWTFDLTGDYITDNWQDDGDFLTRFATGPTFRLGRLELYGTLNVNNYFAKGGNWQNPQINNLSDFFTDDDSFLSWSVGLRI